MACDIHFYRILPKWADMTVMFSLRYYDDYSAPGQPTTVANPTGASAMTYNLATASKTAVLNAAGNPGSDMLWTSIITITSGKSSSTINSITSAVCSTTTITMSSRSLTILTVSPSVRSVSTGTVITPARH